MKTKVTPFETYQTYLSMKNHFTNRKYDFFTYGGKSRATMTSFNKRKDKYWFEKTSRKYSDQEITDFLLANFVTADTPQNLWIGEIINSGEKTYADWMKRQQSLTYLFKEQSTELLSEKKLEEVFNCSKGHPIVLKKYLGGEISLETLTILEKIFSFVKNFDTKLQDPVWESVSLKIRKYLPFLNINVFNYKKILPPVVFPLAETLMIDHPAEQSHIWIGAPMLARHQIEDIFPFFVANYILGGSGFGSRLTTEVREKRGLSYSVFSGFSLLKQKGPFFIGLQTSKQNTTVALKVVQKTLTDFVNNGPDELELEKAKTGLIGGFALKLDSNKKALMNLSQIAYYGLPLDYLDNWVDRIASVTKEDVKRVLRTYFVSENMQTVIVGN